MRKRTNCIIGIDPGFSGGIAIYDPIRKELAAVCPMPVNTEIRSRKKYNEIDIKQVENLIGDMVEEYGAQNAVIERVAASPQMGVTSAFKFGDGFGAVRAVLELLVPKVHYVSPQKWKSRLMLDSDKKESVALARKLMGAKWFPHISKDGLAEAALIAFYGAKDLVVVTEEEEDPLS